MRMSLVGRRIRRPHPLAALAAIIAVAPVLTGCGAPAAPAPGGTRIVVASYPLQFLAERIGGDSATVENLTAPGAEPHDLELTAQQLGSLSEADLVIYQRGFQPAVDEAIAAVAPSAVVDVSVGITQQPGPADDHGEADDDHPERDPHIWLDPTLMATMAQTIGTALAEATPADAEAVSKATAVLIEDLNALDIEFSSGLATCQRREFVTSHAAFGYLATRYDLVQIPIAGLDPTTEPTAARIKQVHDLVSEHGVTTIFYETLVSDAVAQAMATDLGLRTDVLDPLEGLTQASRGSDYLEVMRANLAALRTANGCQ